MFFCWLFCHFIYNFFCVRAFDAPSFVLITTLWQGWGRRPTPCRLATLAVSPATPPALYHTVAPTPRLTAMVTVPPLATTAQPQEQGRLGRPPPVCWAGKQGDLARASPDPSPVDPNRRAHSPNVPSILLGMVVVVQRFKIFYAQTGVPDVGSGVKWASGDQKQCQKVFKMVRRHVVIISKHFGGGLLCKVPATQLFGILLLAP